MKESYENIELEILTFENEDVITTSPQKVSCPYELPVVFPTP